MAKELRRNFLYGMALGIIYLCVGMPTVRADELADPVSTYGLDRIVSSRLANSDMMTIDVAPVAINHKTIYVADFYGDGLIRYALWELPEFDGARIKISMRKMSDIVSGAALGTIQQARRIKADNGAIVLEAGEGGITFERDLEQVELKRLQFYQMPWVTPPRYTVKKNKAKVLAQLARLQNIAEQ